MFSSGLQKEPDTHIAYTHTQVHINKKLLKLKVGGTGEFILAAHSSSLVCKQSEGVMWVLKEVCETAWQQLPG